MVDGLFFGQFALLSTAMIDMAFPIDHDAWRQTHLGRLLGHAMRRFDERVLALMAHDPEVPLALSNLAARAQVSAAHIHITRHLAREGGACCSPPTGWPGSTPSAAR